jgi:hypothetical protein
MNLQLTLPDDRYRRLAGLALGAGLGFVLGVVSQFGDRLALPGIPLHQAPFGAAGNILLFTAIGGLLGLLVSWLRSGLAGIGLAALVIVVVLLALNYLTRRDANLDPAQYLITSVFLITPLWGMLVPLVGAVRWAAGNLEEAHRDGIPVAPQLWRPALLVVVVFGVGLLMRYPARSRPLLIQTHQMLQLAQVAPDREALPEPLRELLAGDYVANKGEAYGLSWDSFEIERYRIPRPGQNFNEHSVVIAHFDNGWNLVCLWISAERAPVCQGMSQLPR